MSDLFVLLNYTFGVNIQDMLFAPLWSKQEQPFAIRKDILTNMRKIWKKELKSVHLLYFYPLIYLSECSSIHLITEVTSSRIPLTSNTLHILVVPKYSQTRKDIRFSPVSLSLSPVLLPEGSPKKESKERMLGGNLLQWLNHHTWLVMNHWMTLFPATHRCLSSSLSTSKAKTRNFARS